MGAGIDPKEWRKRLYNALKAQQRDLNRAGVPTLYKNLQLFPDTTGRTDDFAFNISYRTLRASNGETAGMRYVTVIDNGVETMYGSDWDSQEGIDHIKRHYANPESYEVGAASANISLLRQLGEYPPK